MYFSMITKFIIPHTKYLILNEQNYYLFDIPCKEIIPEEFICNEANPIRATEDAPCEVQLLKISNNLTNCRLVPVEINKIKVQ